MKKSQGGIVGATEKGPAPGGAGPRRWGGRYPAASGVSSPFLGGNRTISALTERASRRMP